jgi:long-chain acyl-CoA synthetase
LPIIFASSNHLAELLKIAPDCPTLRVIVSMDPLTKSETRVLALWAESIGVELLTLAEFEQWGTQEGVKCEPGPVRGIAGEEELDQKRVVTISYTSGTTGGFCSKTMLSHALGDVVLGRGSGLTRVLIG